MLANTVQNKDYDGRFSTANKEWAKSIVIGENEEQSRQFIVEEHPAVVDGFITIVRNKQKEIQPAKSSRFYTVYFEQGSYGEDVFTPVYLDEESGEIGTLFKRSFDTQQEIDELINKVNTDTDVKRDYVLVYKSPDELNKMSEEIRKNNDSKTLSGKHLSQTKSGYNVVNITKDQNERNIAIVYRHTADDFIVAARYDTNDGEWAQGYYVKSLDDAEQLRTEKYGDSPKIYENKEWKTMTEKMIEITVSRDAFIKRYEKSSFMRMPTNSDYDGYTYFIYNNRIKKSTQIADLQSDSRELAFAIRLKEDEQVEISNRDLEKSVKLSASEFKKLVHGTLDKDYIRKDDQNKSRWTTINVPREAIRIEREKATIFVMPKSSEFAGCCFSMPNGFVTEDNESDGDRMNIRVPDDFPITVRNKDGDTVKVSVYQLFRMMNDTSMEDYPQEKREAQPTSQAQSKAEGNFKSVNVDEKAKIATYDKSTLFRMPKGEYDGYCYYIPNNLVRTNDEKKTVNIGLPQGFVVKLINNQAESEEAKEIDVKADDFIAQVKGKTADDYTVYSKPSASKLEQFAETERRLRERVPNEMKNKPNWVIVRTKPNEVRGRLDKFLIDIHTGKMAKSDDPSTWTSFDEAIEYAKNNGGVALAYALDGKDGIACIDLDDCFEENGDMKPFTLDLYNKCDGFYCEKSVSGKGLHIFGKTQGMDVRTFSQDGEMEFYRNAHFIAMTGDDFGGTELKSFDEPQIKNTIESKCAKRTPIVGERAGVDGLSRMSDRDVVERAENGKDGERFKALYSGQDIHNDHSRSDMSLMNMLAFWCNGDKEQMLRIFATSGLYRPEKSDNYYECTVIKAIRDTVSRFQPKAQVKPITSVNNSNSNKGGK